MTIVSHPSIAYQFCKEVFFCKIDFPAYTISPDILLDWKKLNSIIVIIDAKRRIICNKGGFCRD
jgi:hypothetical protein